MKRNGFAAITIILLVVIVLTIAIGIWYYEAYTPHSTISAATTPAQSTSHSSATAATTTVLASSTIDTSSWKTYQSDKLGIEIKYPSDWYGLTEANYQPSPLYVEISSQPLENAGQVKPDAANGDKVEIDVGTDAPFDDFLPATETFQQYEADEWASNETDGSLVQVISTSSLMVDRDPAFETIETDGERVDILVPRKNAIISIQFYGNDNDVFQGMLSTFKIL